MNSLIGTYECKIDAKGRILLPVSLKKQFSSMERGFVLKRSVFESCLEFWPMQKWETMMSKLNKLNPFDKKNDQFLRRFMAGVKYVEVDEAGRFLISKDLIEFARLSKDVVFSSKVDILEIWDKELYEKNIASDDFDFQELAQEVMSNISFDE
ncbi:division/cell wall cluster transcriptional repressor MraZ [Myroides sp. LJL119]